jgi:hypothetical protein
MNKLLLRLLLAPEANTDGGGAPPVAEGDTDAEFDAMTGFAPPEAPADPDPDPEPAAPVVSDEDDSDEDSAANQDDDDDSAPAPAAPAPVVTPANGSTPAARDYSRFPVELRDFAAKLPNAYFARAEKELIPLVEKAKQFDAVVRERDELRAQVGKVPTYAHDHPEGYVLDPNFQQLNTAAERCAFEEQFWSQQLENIENGKPYVDLLGYNPKTGDPVYKQMPAPGNGTVDIRAKIDVQKNLTQASMQRVNLEGARNQYRGHYAAQAQAAATELEESNRKIFKNLDEAKFDPKEKQYTTFVRDALPPVYRSHPLVKPLGLAFVAYMRLAQQYSELAGKYNGRAKAAASRQQRGPRPTGGAPAPVANGGAGETYDLDAMLKNPDRI